MGNNYEEEEESCDTLERQFSSENLESAVKRRKTSDGSSKFKHKAGRQYASEVLKVLVECSPALIGGSGDVSGSCGGHYSAIQGHFLPPSFGSKYPGASYAGRYIHFGVREHAALAIMNGISSGGCLIPYSTLFTVFYQYGLPATRMASISKFPVLYIGTHDSIDVGEDGPTHQPVEVLPQLRAMPNLLVIRPANVEEMVGAFQVFCDQYDRDVGIGKYVDPKPIVQRPVFIMTSRGELGLPYKSNTSMRGQEGVWKGAYVVHNCYDELTAAVSHVIAPRASKLNAFPGGAVKEQVLPDIVLIGSGQEVALIMKAKEILLQMSHKFNLKLQGIFGDVDGFPCWELFDEQDQ